MVKVRAEVGTQHHVKHFALQPHLLGKSQGLPFVSPSPFFLLHTGAYHTGSDRLRVQSQPWAQGYAKIPPHLALEGSAQPRSAGRGAAPWHFRLPWSSLLHHPMCRSSPWVFLPLSLPGAHCPHLTPAQAHILHRALPDLTHCVWFPPRSHLLPIPLFPRTHLLSPPQRLGTCSSVWNVSYFRYHLLKGCSWLPCLLRAHPVSVLPQWDSLHSTCAVALFIPFLLGCGFFGFFLYIFY